jgi:hypothetical protein
MQTLKLEQKIAALPEDVIYVNPEDWNNNFWKNKYLISMPAIGTSHFAVNADHEQDAMDYVIDYCEEKGWYAMTEQEILEEKYLGEYVNGGNHGIFLNVPWHEVNTVQIAMDYRKNNRH